MNGIRSIVGENIRKFREQKKMTQQELATEILVSFQAVSAWERGQNIPDLENAVRLSEVFGISVDQLLYDEKEKLYVGIDGGGTKTEFCCFTLDGTVRNRVFGSASNPNDVGKDRCVEILLKGIEEVTGGVRPKRIFAGIAGAGAGDWKKILREELSPKWQGEFFVDSDAANALSLGSDPDHSAMVICGTGSCVFVREGNECHRLGGWGQLFDESGSAYDVGKDAIRHCLGVLDGLEEKSLLFSAVEEKLGCGIWEGIPFLYEKGRSYIASFALPVVKTFEQGDPVSERILQKNADRLGLLLKTAMKKFGGIDTFVEAGSFFKCTAFKEMVEIKSGCRLVDPGLPPIYGACVEALRRGGENIPTDFRKKFIKSYGGQNA